MLDRHHPSGPYAQTGFATTKAKLRISVVEAGVSLGEKQDFTAYLPDWWTTASIMKR